MAFMCREEREPGGTKPFFYINVPMTPVPPQVTIVRPSGGGPE